MRFAPAGETAEEIVARWFDAHADIWGVAVLSGLTLPADVHIVLFISIWEEGQTVHWVPAPLADQVSAVLMTRGIFSGIFPRGRDRRADECARDAIEKTSKMLVLNARSPAGTA